MKTRKFGVIQGGRKRGNKLRRGLFGVGMAALALFLLWNSLGYLALWAADVTIAAKSELISSLPVECFILRDECALRAPQAGEYAPLVDNGAKVRKGQEIARLKGPAGESVLTAPKAGLLLHTLDGYEGKFSLDSPLNASLLAAAQDYINSAPPRGAALQVSAGDLVGVIITNAGYKLLTALSFHSPDQRQKIEAEDGNSYTVIPRQVLQAEDKFWVLWDLVSPLSDALACGRTFSGQLITDKQQAVLAPAKALCTKDGVQGVIVFSAGKTIFNPVEVVYSRGEQVGVIGLAHGQRILTFPWWASLVKRWWLR